MAPVRQSRPDSGLGVQVKSLGCCKLFSSRSTGAGGVHGPARASETVGVEGSKVRSLGEPKLLTLEPQLLTFEPSNEPKILTFEPSRVLRLRASAYLLTQISVIETCFTGEVSTRWGGMGVPCVPLAAPEFRTAEGSEGVGGGYPVGRRLCTYNTETRDMSFIVQV